MLDAKFLMKKGERPNLLRGPEISKIETEKEEKTPGTCHHRVDQSCASGVARFLNYQRWVYKHRKALYQWQLRQFWKTLHWWNN